MKSTLRLTLAALGAAMLILATVSAHADDFQYQIEDGTVTITGYTGPGGDVVIPNPVTSIGDWAFYGCSSLTTIELPNSVTIIGEGTFTYCTGLTNITIGSGVASIGDSVFFGCTALISVSIPDSVTSIGWEAFSGCTSLTGVYFHGPSPSLVEANVFYETANVTVYYLPGATGWEAEFGGRPTVLWNPLLSTQSIQMDGFRMGSREWPTSPSWWKPPQIWSNRIGLRCIREPSPAVLLMSPIRTGRIKNLGFTGFGRLERPHLPLTPLPPPVTKNNPAATGTGFSFCIPRQIAVKAWGSIVTSSPRANFCGRRF